MASRTNERPRKRSGYVLRIIRRWRGQQFVNVVKRPPSRSTCQLLCHYTTCSLVSTASDPFKLATTLAPEGLLGGMTGTRNEGAADAPEPEIPPAHPIPYPLPTYLTPAHARPQLQAAHVSRRPGTGSLEILDDMLDLPSSPNEIRKLHLCFPTVLGKCSLGMLCLRNGGIQFLDLLLPFVELLPLHIYPMNFRPIVFFNLYQSF